jgi:hypothetical protein
MGAKIVVTSVFALVLLGASLAPPGDAHDTSISHNWRRHYRPLAQKIFYTKDRSEARFVNLGEQASSAALLDGLDSTAFAAAAHVHSGDDITSGTVAEARIAAALARDAEVFGIVMAADGAGSGLDADLLDGQTSADFALAGETQGVQWFKESAEAAALTATSERAVFTAPEAVTITGILIEPAASLTADDTNYATITVARRDATGGNKATVRSLTTQTSGTGGSGNWTAFSTISVGSFSNTSLSAGQKITIEISKTGLGVAVPVVAVQVQYTVD